MLTKAKLTEVLNVTPAANWVPIASYNQFMGVAMMELADDGEGVTVQLRKATGAAGENAADHGTAVTVLSTAADTDVVATAAAYADELGAHTDGTRYTHVTATVAAAGSPAPAETIFGAVIRSAGRYSE